MEKQYDRCGRPSRWTRNFARFSEHSPCYALIHLTVTFGRDQNAPSFEMGVHNFLGWTVSCNLERCCAWMPGLVTADDWQQWACGEREPDAEGDPDVTFLPPMLRRRLSRFSKMALHVARGCLGQNISDVRSVFTSRYGEQTTSLRLLKAVVDDEPLSPTAFSLSVHNTASGLFSIATQNHAPVTAIASRKDTFGYGWLEAAQLLYQDAERPVLLVMTDEPLSDVYRQYADEMEESYAFAFLLSAKGKHQQLEVACESMTKPKDDTTRPPLAVEFYRWWLQGADLPLSLAGQRNTWQWSLL